VDQRETERRQRREDRGGQRGPGAPVVEGLPGAGVATDLLALGQPVRGQLQQVVLVDEVRHRQGIRLLHARARGFPASYQTGSEHITHAGPPTHHQS